jgi:aspergillopepsin I
MTGGKIFNLEIDTGSSDTWIVNKTYQCFDINTNATIPQSSCNFGSGYAPGREFKLIPNENFEILYGDGTTIYGIFGNVKVKVGGIS